MMLVFGACCIELAIKTINSDRITDEREISALRTNLLFLKMSFYFRSHLQLFRQINALEKLTAGVNCI